jgi:hypothetical protein
MDYHCEQCGAEVGPTDCRQGTIAYPFTDGAGIVGAVFKVEGGAGLAPRFWIQGGKRLDAQALPSWEPPEHADLVTSELTEAQVFRHCGRVVHPKSSWRDLLKDSLATSDAVLERVADGLWIAAGPSAADIDAISAEDADLVALRDAGELARLPLVGAGPLAVPWVEHELQCGFAAEWMHEEAFEQLMVGSWHACAFVETAKALDALTGALRLAQLAFTVSGLGEEAEVTGITTPREEVYDHTLTVRSVLRLAVETAICPGDAGRLAAEHVVASLMGLEL